MIYQGIRKNQLAAPRESALWTCSWITARSFN